MTQNDKEIIKGAFVIFGCLWLMSIIVVITIFTMKWLVNYLGL